MAIEKNKNKEVTLNIKKETYNIFNKKNYTIYLTLKDSNVLILSPNGVISKIEKSKIDFNKIPDGVEIFK